MTEERKRYLASISKEERIIRKQIRDYKYAICNCKDELSEHPKSIWLRVELREYKVVLEALKKQLPAPIKEGIFYNMKDFSCPTCDALLDTCVENYCFNCGQKLR